MEKINLMTLVITLTVGVIIAGSLLAPVISDATETEKTFVNDSYYSLEKVDDQTETLIRWDSSAPTTVKINGESKDLSNLPTNKSYTLVGSESVMVRYSVYSNVTYIEWLGSNYLNDNSNSPLTFVEISIMGKTLTFRDDRSTPTNLTMTLSGESFYIVPGDGPYSEVMKDSTKPAFVKADSTITLIGSNTPVMIGTYGVGSIDDGLTMKNVYKSNTITSDVTYSEPVATYSAVDGFEDLFLLDKFEFTMSYDETTENATYTYFIVPASVTAELSNHLGAGEIALLNVIPTMVIVALIVMALGAIYVKRTD